MVQSMRTAAAIVAALVVAAPAAAQSWAPAQPTLSSDEMAWHVRAGLNVAALACRDADAATMVAQYNAMLATESVPLAAARAGVEAGYRARFGAAWQARDDDDMTRLYSHFATPGAHDALCATARELLRDSETVAPGEFYAFARYALPRLEQALVPAPVAPPRYVLAASDDAPRIAYATNARVPFAPVDDRVAYTPAPREQPPVEVASVTPGDAGPGFSEEP